MSRHLPPKVPNLTVTPSNWPADADPAPAAMPTMQTRPMVAANCLSVDMEFLLPCWSMGHGDWSVGPSDLDELVEADGPLREPHERQRQNGDDRGNGENRGLEIKQHGIEDLDRKRHHPAARQEPGDRHLGERDHEGVEGAREDAGLEHRQRHLAERAPAA